MSTAHQWPRDMERARHHEGWAEGWTGDWMESTLRSVTDSIEDYARREPLKFAACVFGIGFVLGWRMKPW